MISINKKQLCLKILIGLQIIVVIVAFICMFSLLAAVPLSYKKFQKKNDALMEECLQDGLKKYECVALLRG